MKNMIDFRNTVETGVDPRLVSCVADPHENEAKCATE